MLSQAGLSKTFWAEAVNTACYLVNRSPSTAIELKTPEEVWSGSPSNYSHLRIFGCLAYAHVTGDKLEPRAKKCIFVGYAQTQGVKAYRLWCLDPQSPKFMIKRDVTFDESAMLQMGEKSTTENGDQVSSKQGELEVKLSTKNTVQEETVSDVTVDMLESSTIRRQSP